MREEAQHNYPNTAEGKPVDWVSVIEEQRKTRPAWAYLLLTFFNLLFLFGGAACLYCVFTEFGCLSAARIIRYSIKAGAFLLALISLLLVLICTSTYTLWTETRMARLLTVLHLLPRKHINKGLT